MESIRKQQLNIVLKIFNELSNWSTVATRKLKCYLLMFTDRTLSVYWMHSPLFEQWKH